MQNYGTGKRGRPTLASTLAPTIDEDGAAAHQMGKRSFTDDRIAKVIDDLDALRGREHYATVEQHRGKAYLVVADGSTLLKG